MNRPITAAINLCLKAGGRFYCRNAVKVDSFGSRRYRSFYRLLRRVASRSLRSQPSQVTHPVTTPEGLIEHA